MKTFQHCRPDIGRFLLGILLFGATALVAAETPPAAGPDEILLKDYRPQSIYKIPETLIQKSKFPAIDMHSHDRAATDAYIEKWLHSMDEAGVEKVLILASRAGAEFDSVVAKYGKYPTRFAIWCGLDYTRLGQPDFPQAAIAELERCRKAGATGVGELMDKGRGLGSNSTRLGIHIDDPLMDPILEKCAELRMPVNIHVAEDAWMYEPMDKTNDGMTNAAKWQVKKEPGVLLHDEVIDTLERAVKKHPRTRFVAAHMANCCADLAHLGAMLDKYPNLSADIAARFGELAPIPRAAAQFLVRYQDRIVYGTDAEDAIDMYRVTFRILETSDEHFYNRYFRSYHWPLHAWALPDAVLKKIYRDNALKLFKYAQ